MPKPVSSTLVQIFFALSGAGSAFLRPKTALLVRSTCFSIMASLLENSNIPKSIVSQLLIFSQGLMRSILTMSSEFAHQNEYSAKSEEGVEHLEGSS